jgi:hypothetical protein
MKTDQIIPKSLTKWALMSNLPQFVLSQLITRVFGQVLSRGPRPTTRAEVARSSHVSDDATDDVTVANDLLLASSANLHNQYIDTIHSVKE